jgi:hypothetical protein
VGGKESSVMLTPSLPLLLARRQRPPTAFRCDFTFRSHLDRGIQQRA